MSKGCTKETYNVTNVTIVEALWFIQRSYPYASIFRPKMLMNTLQKHISLESVIFLFGFGWSILNSSKVHTNLLIWNICHLELDYNETICDDLSSGNNTDSMTDVQIRHLRSIRYSIFFNRIYLLLFQKHQEGISDLGEVCFYD